MSMEKQGIIKVFEDLEELMGTPVPTIVEDFLRSAIETAFKEVRPEDQIGDNAFLKGFKLALSDYDENVKSFLGK